MKENEEYEAYKEMYCAEFWAKLWATSTFEKVPPPITHFEINILKAKIQIASAQEIMSIWGKIHERIIEDSEPELDEEGDAISIPEEYVEINFPEILKQIFEFASTGVSAYFAFTEQALVTSVSATEVYLKDRLAHAITLNPRLLKRYNERKVEVGRLYDIGPDISKGIGKLIVEDMNFQILENVQAEYGKLFGDEPFTSDEMEKLKEIFAIRHLIVHQSGIVDKRLLSQTKRKLELGERICLERKEVLTMIKFIDQTIRSLEMKLSQKEAKEAKPK